MLTSEHGVLQALGHVMALLLVHRAGEAVPGLRELPLQPLQALLLLPGLPLGLLSHPLGHSGAGGRHGDDQTDHAHAC